MDNSAVHGCSPYGASTIAGGKGELKPHQIDLDGARFQGKHIAEIAAKLSAKWSIFLLWKIEFYIH